MKRCRYVAVLVLLLSVCASAVAGAQEIAPEKRAAIEKLIEVTGALKLGQQFSAVMVRQMTSALRSTHPDVPQKALDILPEVVNGVVAENIGTFKELIIRIYDQHFTLEDVRGLSQFYSTDLGQKVIKNMPGILQESIEAGQQWGRALAPEIAQRMQARFQKENISL